jgi:TatD DNase family protein
MFIDTHGHLNSMLKNDFDTRLTTQDIANASHILQDAYDQGVQSIINVATSLVESNNSVMLAHAYQNVFATVGIHPNDCTASWRSDFNDIRTLAKNKHTHKIVGIGECGVDRHYPNDPNYNLARQNDAFRAHIELALEYDLALVVHSRDAYDETLRILDEYAHDIKRGVMHCFSYDQAFADHVIKNNFILGIGGTVTYPKNAELRTVVAALKPEHFVLETDAPFLPPQQLRGQKNHPKYIPIIAAAIAELRGETVAYIGQKTTSNAILLFALDMYALVK